MSVRSEILDQFKQVALEQDKRLGSLSDELPLMDSGLDSLCFAIVVSRLETVRRDRGTPWLFLDVAHPPRALDVSPRLAQILLDGRQMPHPGTASPLLEGRFLPRTK